MNLLAFGIMYPASFILTPRWFHKVNVFMIRSESHVSDLTYLNLFPESARRLYFSLSGSTKDIPFNIQELLFMTMSPTQRNGHLTACRGSFDA
jgi:hypothetical protein